jgi:hypothetical protein
LVYQKLANIFSEIDKQNCVMKIGPHCKLRPKWRFVKSDPVHHGIVCVHLLRKLFDQKVFPLPVDQQSRRCHRRHKVPDRSVKTGTRIREKGSHRSVEAITQIRENGNTELISVKTGILIRENGNTDP